MCIRESQRFYTEKSRKDHNLHFAWHSVMVIYTVQYKSQVNSGILNLMFVISPYIFYGL